MAKFNALAADWSSASESDFVFITEFEQVRAALQAMTPEAAQGDLATLNTSVGAAMPATVQTYQKSLTAWQNALGELQKLASSAKTVALEDLSANYLKLSSGPLAKDATVLITATPISTSSQQIPMGSLSVDVARAAGTHVGFGTGLIYSFGSNVSTYSTIPTIPAQTNGTSTYKIIKENKESSVDANISGIGYYIWDEEVDPWRAFLGGIGLKRGGRSGLMMGISASTGSGTSTTDAVYLVGYSIFLDRDLSGALSFGMAFRKGQRLSGGVSLTDVITTSTVPTSDRWGGAFFIGLNWTIASN